MTEILYDAVRVTKGDILGEGPCQKRIRMNGVAVWTSKTVGREPRFISVQEYEELLNQQEMIKVKGKAREDRKMPSRLRRFADKVYAFSGIRIL